MLRGKEGQEREHKNTRYYLVQIWAAGQVIGKELRAEAQTLKTTCGAGRVELGGEEGVNRICCFSLTRLYAEWILPKAGLKEHLICNS